MRKEQVVESMTGASPVTTLHGCAWQSHAVEGRIVVTGLAPVMPPRLNALLKAQQFLS